MLPGSLNQTVHQAEIEPPLLGLQQLPGHRGQHRVEVGGRDFGPERPHVLHAGGAGVVQFRAENQERLAVHDQLRGRAALFQVRNVGGGPALRKGRSVRKRYQDCRGQNTLQRHWFTPHGSNRTGTERSTPARFNCSAFFSTAPLILTFLNSTVPTWGPISRLGLEGLRKVQFSKTKFVKGNSPPSM